MEKKIINEYESMRVLLTLLVIIGHCQYDRILTPYGGIDFLFPGSSGLAAFRALHLTVKAIYSFHMAAFFALSGALFCRSHERRPGLSLRALCVAKARRLLIPFAAVTLFYVFPLKLASRYWFFSTSLAKDVAAGQLLLQGNTHLWFLPTLFFAFIAVYLLVKARLPVPAIGALLFAAHAVSGFIPIKAVSYILEYSLWFYTGFVFETHREKVNESVTKRNFIIAAALFIAVFAADSRLRTTLVRVPAGIVLALLGTYITYALSYCLSKKRLCKTKIYKGLVRNSFGLYLYSDPINYVLLAISASCFGKFAFATNAGVVFMFILRFAVTSVGAYRVSELVRKLRIRYLV